MAFKFDHFIFHKPQIPLYNTLTFIGEKDI